MGTDIHGGLFRKTWNGGHEFVELPPVLDNRNYRFFAIIADVRNGYGFAGVETHTSIVPISNDDSPVLKIPGLEVDSYGTAYLGEQYIGDHSIRTITWQTILDTELHLQEVTSTGTFTASEYEKFLVQGIDGCSYCGGINQPVLSEEEYKLNPDPTAYIRAHWVGTPFKYPIEQLKNWINLYIDYNTKLDENFLVIGFDS